ncbi:MAG: hypothetical protein OEY11_12940, partial [Gammaproteobacteria bacterium]|nr:hypothetical protein [Gammaproteobacteria bacterium]
HALAAATNEVVSLHVTEDIDVDINIYAADGKKVLLWLACNEGRQGAETHTAERLASQGIEVWLPDFLTAHFLPQGPSSIFKVAAEEVAAVIDVIYKKHAEKKLYLLAGGRASTALLRGIVEWEKQNPDNTLGGALLLYPRLNLLEPVPGTEPVYIKAVGQSKLPVLILEGEHTPNRWGLAHLSSRFALSADSVDYELLPRVRGYFYTRPDKTEAEQALSKKLPDIIKTQLDRF